MSNLSLVRSLQNTKICLRILFSKLLKSCYYWTYYLQVLRFNYLIWKSGIYSGCAKIFCSIKFYSLQFSKILQWFRDYKTLIKMYSSIQSWKAMTSHQKKIPWDVVDIACAYLRILFYNSLRKICLKKVISEPINFNG